MSPSVLCIKWTGKKGQVRGNNYTSTLAKSQGRAVYTIKKHELSISGIFFKLKFLLTRSIGGIVLLVGKEFLSNRKMFANVKSSLKMCCEDHEYGVLAPSGS